MQPIAIVGMACRYPDARSPQELWENALAQRRAFRRIPEQRFNLNDYYHPDRNIPDRTYSSQGAFITDYAFNREYFRISGKTYRSSDLTHWLALDVADQAFADAGFPEVHALPTTTVGVLVGNTLTGEFSRAQSLRLRWPYVARVVTHALLKENWQPDAIRDFLDSLEHDYKQPFAPVGEETLAGGLSNTIAGRICNYFNLQGGGYTVDGACSSSLLAIIHACKALETHDIDVALAGGVDLSIDPFEIIGFAKTSALTAEEMRVYDKHSQGFLPGEGCGFVVLMRYEDALAQQCRVYAVIRGWGISSDGSGGITRPEVEGQYLSLMRAYQKSNCNMARVPYFEGHGTGTAVGDTTELQSLTFTYNQMNSVPLRDKACISSIKANIGHTKAAAGVAGFIKATMALFSQIIPPTTGMIDPHPELTYPNAKLQALRQGKLWLSDAPLLAGVSSMGFGGINTHLVLEGIASKRRETLTAAEQKLLTSFQDAELFLLRAQSLEALQEQIVHLVSLAFRLSYAELTDLAAYLAAHLQPGTVRAALIASKPREFELGLKKLLELISAGYSSYIDTELHIYLGHGTNVPRVAFLFPGQGSPTYTDGGILRSCFPEIDTLYQQLAVPEAATDGKRTEIAQPAITIASVAGLLTLEQLGVQAHIGIGHSLGELTALRWADVIDTPALLRITRARGNAMGQVKNLGAMLSVKADAQTVSTIIQHTPVVIAGLNSPRQTVIAGDVLSVNKIAARLRTQKMPHVLLAVSHAFHSPLLAPAIDALTVALQRENFAPPRRQIVSTVTGDFLKDDHIQELLCRQVTAPVRFLEAVERVQDDIDLFIEVGPGHALTKIIPDITPKPVITTDAGSLSIRGTLSACAATFVLGTPLNIAALFSHRFTRPIDLSWNPSFLANPCEQAPLSGAELPEKTNFQENACEQEAVPYCTAQTTLELVQQIVATRAELPPHLIGLESRMLSDLHLNSITVGQILAEAGRVLNLTPSASLLTYADAKLSEIVQMIEDLQSQETSEEKHKNTKEPESLSTWVRCFSVIEQEYPPVALSPVKGTGNWHVFTPVGYQLTEELIADLGAIEGTGSVVCLPPDLNADYVSLLYQAVQAVLTQQQATHFVLVQHGEVGAAFARTLYLEHPDLTVCILHIPLDLPTLLACIVTEIQAANGFIEITYDKNGKRTGSTLVPYVPIRKGEPVHLDQRDVLLVTGGGKGIAAECALSLAQETGTALALLGRSQPQRDPELAAQLVRLNAAGVRYLYIPVDIRDASATAQAVCEVEARLGSITAILHGAGVNHPTPLRMLNEESITETLAPKVAGFQNLLRVITPQKIKYLITFGSVIARTGMQGEAHYALANEWLAYLTEIFQRAYPDSFCLCTEWSVWSDIGMGERLGRVEALREQGIAPIPVQDGITILRQLLSHRQSATRIVVSGRLGTLPTLKLATRQLPFLRFLEKPLVFYPDIELIAEVEISSATDLYLDEHCWQNTRLIPAVVGLEAMAQMAIAVTGNQARPCFRNVQFAQPLVVPDQTSVTLRLMALVMDDGTVEVAIRSSETAYTVNHFQARCIFESQYEVIEAVSSCSTEKETVVPLHLPDDLYNQLLFHRGRFQRILRYTSLHARECRADITPYIGEYWFSRYLPQKLVLGDPAGRDALIHAIQACIPQATLLPVGIESLHFVPRNMPSDSLVHVYARERAREGNSFFYDVEARDNDGFLLEQWNGLHLQLVGTTFSHNQWAAALFGSYIERRLAEFSPGTQPLLTVHQGIDAVPILDILTPDQVQSCVHLVQERETEYWRSVLSTNHYRLAEHIHTASGETFALAATRVLSSGELLRNVGSSSDVVLKSVRDEGDGWQILATGQRVLLSFATQVQSSSQLVVFTFYCPKPA